MLLPKGDNEPIIYGHLADNKYSFSSITFKRAKTNNLESCSRSSQL